MTTKLKCGDPAVGPATYTRFVLPFAYCPVTPEQDQNNDIYYEEAQPDDLFWRGKYLTYETADVLFRKARWFILRDPGYPLPVDMHFRDCEVGQNIALHIKPPRLVLFEWPESGKTCKKQCDMAGGRGCSIDEHNVLRVGFLVVEVYFPQQNHIFPTLDSLLELNELFRYWQQPFDGHEDQIRNGMGYRKLLANFPYSHGSTETIAQKQDRLDLYFWRWASLLEIPVQDCDGNLRNLFPRKWMESVKDFASGEVRVLQAGPSTRIAEPSYGHAQQ